MGKKKSKRIEQKGKNHLVIFALSLINKQKKNKNKNDAPVFSLPYSFSPPHHHSFINPHIPLLQTSNHQFLSSYK